MSTSRFPDQLAAVSGAVVATYLLGSTIKCTPNLFFCAVVLTSWLGGVGAGIFAVFLSVIALDYYFIPPIYALGIGLEEAPDMMVFVASATFMSWLNGRGDLTRGPTRRAPINSKVKVSPTNVEPGKAGGFRKSEVASGELVHQSLVETRNGAPRAKCTKSINKSPNKTVSEVEADEEIKRGSRAQAPGPDKRQVVLSDGARDPLLDLHPYSRQDTAFCKRGDYWTIQYEGQESWLKATRGLECLARLLGNPGREFHVIELVGRAPSVRGLPRRGVQQDSDRMANEEDNSFIG